MMINLQELQTTKATIQALDKEERRFSIEKDVTPLGLDTMRKMLVLVNMAIDEIENRKETK